VTRSSDTRRLSPETASHSSVTVLCSGQRRACPRHARCDLARSGLRRTACILKSGCVEPSGVTGACQQRQAGAGIVALRRSFHDGL